MEKHPINNREALSSEERFGEIYEGAVLLPISYDELPNAAALHFEHRAQLLVSPKEYKPKNFSHIYLLTHPDGRKTYVAEHEKSFEEGEKDQWVYFADYEGDTMAGYGDLVNNIESQHELNMIGKPYTNFTRTYGVEDKEGGGQDFRGKGFGQRRIIEMNAYAQARFGYPLHSSSIIKPDQGADGLSTPERIWERLVAEGKAESFVEGKGEDARTMYRMR